MFLQTQIDLLLHCDVVGRILFEIARDCDESDIVGANGYKMLSQIMQSACDEILSEITALNIDNDDRDTMDLGARSHYISNLYRTTLSLRKSYCPEIVVLIEKLDHLILMTL